MPERNAGPANALDRISRRACRFAIGITVVAVGVQNETELAKLRELKFNGATGPGVSYPPCAESLREKSPVNLGNRGAPALLASQPVAAAGGTHSRFD